jgi:hypothetical protein
MKEIVNSIGTLVTLVALIMALIIGGTAMKILAGIGIVYAMNFHDEILKMLWKEEKEKNTEIEEIKQWVDKPDNGLP